MSSAQFEGPLSLGAGANFPCCPYLPPPSPPVGGTGCKHKTKETACNMCIAVGAGTICMCSLSCVKFSCVHTFAFTAALAMYTQVG